MMQQSNVPRLSVLCASVVFSVLLTLIAWPKGLSAAMPQWMLIITFFWIAAVPERCGIVFAFLMGLLADCITGVLFGSHAFIFILLSYCVLKMRLPLSRMPMWQQMAFVSTGSMLNVLWQYLVAQMIGQVMLTTAVWFSVISSAVVWPILAVSLHRFYARRVII